MNWKVGMRAKGKAPTLHADATSAVIRPDTLKHCNFTLNIFQDFVFTNFKQERPCLRNYRLFILFQGVNKTENHH